MTKLFQEDGISFRYPANWVLEREEGDGGWTVSVQSPDTAFLVVAAPEPDALREASYFVERRAQEGMPLAGLVLNRVHRSPAAGVIGSMPARRSAA